MLVELNERTKLGKEWVYNPMGAYHTQGYRRQVCELNA
uniref:Uncharacterized protein n=1 Tax=Anguilla anguilla TaxID=7936 RepID=A0A0E9RIV0_ANGAN